MGKSQRLYQEAKRIIPGGTQLLSKRPEMFLPEKWPAYYKKAKGVDVWDLDDKKYIDMSLMGVGSCILGYAHNVVNQAVLRAIENGNMTTLNCYEEVELAKKLLKLHPWAEMVRFSRTGGEACAIGIRIGRAFAKKDKVAFCGYHGWHDWYLSANLADNSNLDGQLLPGLEPLGVPRALKRTSLPFHYGQIDELKALVSQNKNEIGVIIMEVCRHKKIDVDFLKAVKTIAKEISAVLVFDEVSSGFRVTTGGMHLLYGVNPDMAIFGKALGNGYPISAIIGTRKVMESAQNTFISSTYWTERIGFVAGLETIKIFEEENVPRHLVQIGGYIRDGLIQIFEKYSLNIEIAGLPSVPILAIKEEEPLVVKTILTQEMLKKGFLASNIIYISLAHTKAIADKYLEAAEDVFGKIARSIKKGDLKKLLKGPVCHAGFKRLT